MKHCLSLWLLGALSAEATQDQRSEDRETINGKVVGWYRITQKIPNQAEDEHVGFASEEIEEIRERKAYRYQYELQSKVFTPAEYVTVTLSLSAELDSDFDLTSLSARYLEGSDEVKFGLAASGQDRTVYVEPGRPSDLSRDDEVHFHLPLSTILLRQKGRLPGTGKAVLSMFFPKGEQGANQSPMTIEITGHGELKKLAGDGNAQIVEAEVAGFPTTMKELLVTFVKIDRFGRAVYMETERDVVFTLVATSDEARGDLQADRRDPFRKDQALHLRPKTKPTGAKTTGKTAPREGETETTVEPSQALKELKAKADELFQAQAEGRTADADRLYVQFLELYVKTKAALRDPKAPEVRELFALKRKVEDSYGGARNLMDTLVLRMVEQIVELAKNDELTAMESKLAELAKVGERPEFDEAIPTRDEFRRKFLECEDLVVTTRVRLEFLKLSLTLTGTSIGMEDVPQRVDFEMGVLGHRIRIRETIPFLRSRTFARIRVDKKEADYRIGDAVLVEKDKKVVVVEITRWSVTVALPEQLRDRPSNSKEKVTVKEQLRELGLMK